MLNIKDDILTFNCLIKWKLILILTKLDYFFLKIYSFFYFF